MLWVTIISLSFRLYQAPPLFSLLIIVSEALPLFSNPTFVISSIIVFI